MWFNDSIGLEGDVDKYGYPVISLFCSGLTLVLPVSCIHWTLGYSYNINQETPYCSHSDLQNTTNMPTKGLRYMNKVDVDKDAATDTFLHVGLPHP